MDVPFSSSGAISRAHYTLVRQVELAGTPQEGDQHILSEIETIRHRLSRPGLSTRDIKGCLIILLYCSMSLSTGIMNAEDLEYALPFAVNLAGAATTVRDKRTGYLFCAELMTPTHELQLMLINTLIKDLQSSEVPRICLALDSLITSSTEDVVPAVQSRLYELLSHNSAHVRRRTLLAFKALSRFDGALLRHVKTKIIARLDDRDLAVTCAALVVSSEIAGASALVNDLLRKTWSSGLDNVKQWFLWRILRTLRIVRLEGKNLNLIQKIIRFAATSSFNTLLCEATLLISESPLDQLSALRPSPVIFFRKLLMSSDVNDLYTFLTCLGCLDPKLWAGNSPETASVLDGWEVERVMNLLGSSDDQIRKKTLKILYSIDTSIVESHFLHVLKTIPADLTLKERNDYVERCLEVLDVQSQDEGAEYARQLKGMLELVEGGSSEGGHVIERAVEIVLLRIRKANSAFRVDCATTLLVYATELSNRMGPTTIVIISAIGCEFCGKLSIPPVDILRGIASKVPSASPAIQDAGLLSMLRIVAECDNVPGDVTDIVKEVEKHAGRHIRRRCDQFLKFSKQKDILADVISRARSPSLPHFLEALTARSAEIDQLSPSGLSPKIEQFGIPRPTSSRKSKLRYAAYEIPQPQASLRPSVNSRRAAFIPQTNSGRESRASSGLSTSASEGGRALNLLTKTVTAGELAIASAGEYELNVLNKPHSQPDDSFHPNSTDTPLVDDLAARIDLIAFDSPFLVDPIKPLSSADDKPKFESVWDALESTNAQGWCEQSIDVVVRRLQGLEHGLEVIPVDRPPYEGDLKILIVPDPKLERMHAALRLRESDEKSCLWRLRCEGGVLRTKIKQFLTE